MKKIVTGIMFLLLATNAFALQEVAGPLVMSVHVGGSNSAQYGLLNDGNETITVSLRADGDAANYLSFPAKVTLEPNKFVYTSITASIPADYNSVGTITGHLYALQEGSPGQVKINVQLMKAVTITAYGMKQTSNQVSQTNQPDLTYQPNQTDQPNQNSDEANQPNQTNQSNQTNQVSQASNAINQLPSVAPATGLFALISSFSPAILAVFVMLVYIVFRKRRTNDRTDIMPDNRSVNESDGHCIQYESHFKPIDSDKPT